MGGDCGPFGSVRVFNDQTDTATVIGDDGPDFFLKGLRRAATRKGRSQPQAQRDDNKTFFHRMENGETMFRQKPPPEKIIVNRTAGSREKETHKDCFSSETGERTAS